MNHGPNWVFAALGEGLRGWETSVFLFRTLIPTVAAVLTSLINKYTTRLGDPEKVHPSAELKSEVPSDEYDRSLKKAFKDVDHGIVNQAQDMILSSPSKSLNATQLSAAISGTTATLAFYDDGTRILKVANTGDSRAILGRQSQREDGTPYLEVHVLTSEHTSTNPVEQARLRESHSDTDIGTLQRHIGRDVTRAFGLAMCKWSQEVQERMHKEYFCEPPLRDLYLKPSSDSPAERHTPSLTAEPEVTTIHIQPDDFLIMANKGFWDTLTNEEAVGLVGVWLMKRCYGLKAPIYETTDEIFDREMLPVDLPDESGDTTTWYKRWQIPKRFICIDNNAGAHLVRNALGGANTAFTEGLLKVPDPFSVNSRYAAHLWLYPPRITHDISNRDELTVAVIFFE